MVLDLVQPVLARHPCGSHALVLRVQIETAEAFWRNYTQLLSNFFKMVQEETCELAIAMYHDPDPFGGADVSEHMISGRAADLEESLLHEFRRSGSAAKERCIVTGSSITVMAFATQTCDFRPVEARQKEDWTAEHVVARRALDVDEAI
jgi:hypothetical protein